MYRENKESLWLVAEKNPQRIVDTLVRLCIFIVGSKVQCFLIKCFLHLSSTGLHSYSTTVQRRLLPLWLRQVFFILWDFENKMRHLLPTKKFSVGTQRKMRKFILKYAFLFYYDGVRPSGILQDQQSLSIISDWSWRRTEGQSVSLINEKCIRSESMHHCFPAFNLGCDKGGLCLSMKTF